MGRTSKLKLENMRKANELLDKGHIEKYPTKEQVELKPSNNVTNSSPEFVNKMNNLKEEDLGGMTSDPRIMDREYGERELTPTQQKLHDEVMGKIGQAFATWMSPGNPPFSQEYAKGPHWDGLSKNIRDIVINNVE